MKINGKNPSLLSKFIDLKMPYQLKEKLPQAFMQIG